MMGELLSRSLRCLAVNECLPMIVSVCLLELSRGPLLRALIGEKKKRGMPAEKKVPAQSSSDYFMRPFGSWEDDNFWEHVNDVKSQYAVKLTRFRVVSHRSQAQATASQEAEAGRLAGVRKEQLALRQSKQLVPVVATPKSKHAPSSSLPTASLLTSLKKPSGDILLHPPPPSLHPSRARLVF